LNGLVLDIEGGNRNPGAKVIMWQQKPSDNANQLWYDDPATGTIRSKFNDLCLDVEGGVVCMKPFQPGDVNQQWDRVGNLIRNRMMANKVIDISGENREPGAKLCSWDHHGRNNQLFDFEFIGGQPGQPGSSYPPAAAGYPPAAVYPPSSGSYPPPPGGCYPGQPVGAPGAYPPSFPSGY